jgi:CheY-like chemotaxis protein
VYFHEVNEDKTKALLHRQEWATTFYVWSKLTGIQYKKSSPVVRVHFIPPFVDRAAAEFMSSQSSFQAPEVKVDPAATTMESVPAKIVLCVDDEKIGLRVRKIMLESRGYKVLTANDGTEGLKMFDENPVDLVVLDYFMPELNGGEVAAEMRRRRPGVPIVFLSAYFSLPAEALQVADAFITKGDPPDVLIDKIQKLL